MTRKEKDVIGEIELPDGVYYGINTYRALQNFKISGISPDSDHVRSMVLIKKCAALANRTGKKLPEEKADAIVRACDRILDGELLDNFKLDVFQAGAGTSFNMNANEVVANLALEVAGKKKGDYSSIHPNDHVNMSQSTNDVYPTMMRVTAVEKMARLRKEALSLSASFSAKSKEFRSVVKPGRTHLQDAAPVTLGIELASWAYACDRAITEIDSAVDFLLDLNIGGTAVGTGINTAPGFQKNVVAELARHSGFAFRASRNLPGIMEFMSDFNRSMNAVANFAIDLGKVSNDIRLLYSGPGAGIHEIRIPAVQQGSSIMPGKINPSIAEAFNMICHSVLGSQQAVNFSSMAGQLELNVMMPNIDLELTRSIDILTNGIKMFREKLIDGLEADTESSREHMSRSFGSAALLNPVLGYDTVARIVQEAMHTGKSIKSLALATGKIKEEEFDRLMSSGIPK
ncbi:MAG: aspartate ammonia-lyase [Candidatus Thermoplasmatota archaeon]|jgi:fumarate hydratase class II/aspartate ammonia-lyase|nr:aspartate ammonia-lyase [Candidatus Thermoplasmatota archaeon]MCL5785276.1 aspartate ammonia-lyase [Candidatus Thermoplasmatota archaeon]